LASATPLFASQSRRQAKFAGARDTVQLDSFLEEGTAMTDLFRRGLTGLGVLAANPLAFLIVAAYGVLWFLLERKTFDWHGIATLATWFMTLLIQRAEHRDTQAVHAKLDELLHAQSRADNAMTRIDDEQPEDIEKHRQQARKDD
jgi:low affinity Fe/Cu permease